MKPMRIISCLILLLTNGLLHLTWAQEKRQTSIQVKQKSRLAKSVSQTQSFHEFWREFREAVITQNKEKVVDLTLFPLEISGEFDSDPHHFVRRPQFIKLEFYRIFIKADFEGERELIEHVKANPTVSASEEEINNGFVSFYNLEFRQVQGKWRLVNVYQSE
ncbi:MAG: hypothetical protein HY774_18900 [Acidobacteria bacterium]|nr:hypothetical protein [Acidobacteriota bacterium]